jgi:hypothetical protein
LAVATHHAGPMDGHEVKIETTPQTRYWLPAAKRAEKGWLMLARYVYVPPRDGKHVTYRYSGTEQTQGPLPGTKTEPDWSL